MRFSGIGRGVRLPPGLAQGRAASPLLHGWVWRRGGHQNPETSGAVHWQRRARPDDHDPGEA
jgi:hypothetical protein